MSTLAEELRQFYGTEQYYKELFTGILYTDGFHYFLQKADAYWFLTELALYICDKHLRNEEFLGVYLNVKNGKATLKITDGNEKVFFKKNYAYTNCPEGDYTFFYEYGVLLVPSEH